MLASLLLAEGFQPIVAFRLHRQAVAFDQPARHRAAEQPASDHAEGGRGQCHGGRALGAEPFRNRAEGRRRAEAAFQRDRAGHDPEQRVEAEQSGAAYADQVLQYRQRPAGRQVDQQGLAALAQQAEAATEADGGEERHHQGCLQAGVEADVEPAAIPEQPDQEGEAEAGDHRRRYAQTCQPAAALLQLAAEGEQEQGEGGGGQGVQVQCRHGVALLLLCGRKGDQLTRLSTRRAAISARLPRPM